MFLTPNRPPSLKNKDLRQETPPLTCRAGVEEEFKLWNAPAGTFRAELDTSGTASLAFSPDGKWFAAGGLGVEVFEVADWRHVRKLDTPAAVSVAFSPDSSLLAAGCNDNLVRVWDAATGQLRATLRGHSDVVRWVAFSPDGSLLASASDDHTVRLWDVSGFEQEQGETPARADH